MWLYGLKYDLLKTLSNVGFCALPFNQVTFAGAHNAGTGMDENHDSVDCFVKNHDLSVEEMLDFGIRYFDFDVKLDDSDNTLYTGHGNKNLYIKFGKVKDIMEHIHSWMKEHESEIIVIRFGELLGSKIDGLKELKRQLTTTFTTVGKNCIFYTINLDKTKTVLLFELFTYLLLI